ncbi:MAG: LacI family DNA-binding transcriptional regulator [Planctomycetes bacterium]|nr:LacI family DNA-binding transcriptional regulator [Planctomycetota bacterium]
MTRKPNVTQQEIARRLGITQVTVSRALSGKDRLSPGTRERVLALAEELGYRVNGLARRVQEGRYRGMTLLGNLGRLTFNVWEQEFHIAVARTLAERSWHLTAGWLPAEGLADPSVVDGLLDRMLADAALIYDVGPQSPQVEDILARYRITPIWVNAGRLVDGVGFADADGSRLAIHHLLKQGYRRPALLLAGPETDRQYAHISVLERTRGFVGACAEAGLPAWVAHPAQSNQPSEQAKHLHQLLTGIDRPDALLCYAPHQAALVRLVCAECRLRIGADLGLITFVKPNERILDTEVSACQLDYDALGREAVNMAWRRLESGPQPQVLVPITLVRPGATTTR